MWHDLVLKADTLAGYLVLGFMNTCTDHPVVTVGFLGLMLALVAVMWVQMLEIRRGAAGSDLRSAIRLHR